jgi:hypothetical protein
VRQARVVRYGKPEAVVTEGSELALPKHKPQGEPIDYTALAIPKNPPDRSRSFLDIVRGEICAVNHVAHYECGGVTEAAHLEVEGVGIKASDFLTVPLCSSHHAAQHNVGIDTFQLNYGVNLWRVNALLQSRFIRSITKTRAA